MLVRSLAELKTTDRFVQRPNWSSTRLLVASDEMGFSLHVTRIHVGETGTTQYPDHVEAAYCVEGEATLIYNEGASFDRILPGTVYALNKHDAHTMVVHKELVLVCVFQPALHGNENASRAGDKAESAVVEKLRN